MPHELRNIVVKELREIVRDPRLLIGMIIVPVLMMPLMGVGIRSAMEAAQEEVSKMETGLLNQDHATGGHNYSDLLYALMIQNNMIIRNSTAPDANTAVSWAVQNDIGTLVVLPPTFSEEIGNGTSVNVSVYQVLSHFGFDEMAGSERVNSVFTLLTTSYSMRCSETITPAQTRSSRQSPQTSCPSRLSRERSSMSRLRT